MSKYVNVHSNAKTLTDDKMHVKGICIILMAEIIPMATSDKRLNIVLTGDDVDLLEQLQLKLNAELMMKLSKVQIVRRLLRQEQLQSKS